VKLSSDDLPFFFDATHQALALRLRDIAPPLADDHDSARLAARMGSEHGLYDWLVPTGPAHDVRALCLIREALGQFNATADSIFAVQGLGACTVWMAGTPAQKETLAGVKDGSVIGGFGLTEPGAGSDVKALSTTATPDGDGWRLNGEKTFISNVGIAHRFTVFAKVDGQITAFLVPAEDCDPEPIEMSVNHPIGRLRFDNVRIGPQALVGELGGGLKLALSTLGTFRVTVAAAAVGMARRALDEALGHVQRRTQFGKPLAAQQTVQSYLAEMAVELDAARLLVYRAAWLKDTTGQRAALEVSMAKLFATEAAQRVIDKAVQLHGGLGVTAGTPVEALYREIRPLRIYEGTTEIQRLIIARELLNV
jgi:acyl-CoA dehydrogenase